MDDMSNMSLVVVSNDDSEGFTFVILYKNIMKNLVCDAGELYYILRSVRGVSHK